MDLHHLRVLNFSNKISNNLIKADKDVSLNKDSFKNESQKLAEELYTNCQQPTIQSHPVHTDPTFKSTQNRVKEIFHKPEYSLSLDNLWKKPQNARPNKPKARLKRVTRQSTPKPIEKVRSTDDIKVLYTSERAKRKTEKYKRKDINTSSISKLHNNVYLYYQTCKHSGLHQKRKRKRTVCKPNTHRQTFPLLIKGSKKTNGQFDVASMPLHYNTIDFSTGDKVDNCTQKSVQEFSDAYSCHGHTVESLTTKLNVTQIDCDGDANRGINEAVYTDPAFTKFEIEDGIQSTIIDKKPPCTPYINKSKKHDVTTQFFQSLKKIVRYFLFVLTVIAWSPCIIVGFLCWFVVSPLTPNDIKANEEIPICTKSKNKFFSTLIECVTRLYNKLISSFEAVMSSFYGDNKQYSRKTLKENKILSNMNVRKPCFRSKSKSNTNMKYVLYYAGDRGWVMKPMQQQAIGINIKQNQKLYHSDVSNKRWKSRGTKTVTFWDSRRQVDYDNYGQTVQNESNIPGNNFTCSCDYRLASDRCPSNSHNISPPPLPEFAIRHQLTTAKQTESKCPCICGPIIETVRKLQYPCQHINSRTNLMQPCSGNYRRLPTYSACQKLQRPFIRRYKSQNVCTKARKRRHSCSRICSKRHLDSRRNIPNVKKFNGSRFVYIFKSCIRDLKKAVVSAERVWEPGARCGSLYLSPPKKPPCFWIVSCSKMCKSCTSVVLYICSACVWCPIFLCFYCCYDLFCKLL